MPLSLTDIDFSACDQDDQIAVALSGGPDSMALAHLAAQWAQAAHGKILHLLTVDHGLRAESAEEARQVSAWVREWPGVTHHILTWDNDKPGNRILEEARKARYDLLAQYCQAHHIAHLLIAHHQDDQAETFLFRLAKGSGLDGLAAMRPLQIYDDKLSLYRPLLAVAKEELVTYCIDNNIPFVRDPSNENEDYTRPRLRSARAALEQEGLSAKRLARTAMRLSRARSALEEITDEVLKQALHEGAADQYIFKADILRLWPEEIILRVILQTMKALRGDDHDYPPRLEKVEDLVSGWLAGRLIKTQTLGGCLFVPDEKNALLSIRKEI